MRLISLQTGEGAAQLDEVDRAFEVETMGPAFDAGPDAFVDTAATMENLILSSAATLPQPTSLAPWGGPFGRPLSMCLTGDGKWIVPTAPWYPTMTLFRQAAFGDWEACLRQWPAAAHPDRHSVRCGQFCFAQCRAPQFGSVSLCA